MDYHLSIITGDQKGNRLPLREELTIGRESYCDLILNDPKLSRHHGTFRIMGDRLFYRDENSTNGSLLNGERVIESEIKPGDIIRVGRTEIALVEKDDFKTINFVNSESMVTGIIESASVKPDALADKFAQIFDYYKEHQPEVEEAERYELVRTQRMLNGLKTLYSISQSLTRIINVPELLDKIADSLFELYGAAENLVILLQKEEGGELQVRAAKQRDGGKTPSIDISQTVLDEAIRRRSTLIANDAASDSRLAASQSIIGYSVKSVMCAPLISGEQVIGALYLDNRDNSATYDDMDGELLAAFANQCAVAIDNAFLCDTLQNHYHQTLQSLINAIEAKDSYTMGHTARVAKYTVGIGRHYGMEQEHLTKLKMAADLHDIGKIGVKEGIINKKGSLSDTEFSSIKDHVEMGEKILEPIFFVRDLLPWIRAHHEKWDGTGYPDGLVKDEIPLEGRILALADAFDAMTSKRSYNNPMSFEEALNRIKESSGKHFDPTVVKAFDKYLHEEYLPATKNSSSQAHKHTLDEEDDTSKSEQGSAIDLDPRTES